MSKIMQCVPNFSEGRRPEVVEEIVDAFRKEQGVKLLDYSSDEDHNRSVVTLLGEPEALKESVLEAVKRARDLINMEEHEGGHPRLGATDVVPFIPISGVTMEDCQEMAAEVAEAINERLEIPTYLYGEAARESGRENISQVRRGEYEGLKEAIKKSDRHPDFGEPALHPTAGATMVGARMPLVAFNVNLDCSRMEVADRIARNIRTSGGGLVNIKAMGVNLEERNIVQISMNVENYLETPLHRVFELIRVEAARFGVSILESEIVGLVPMEALVLAAGHYLQLGQLDDKQILENNLLAE